MAFQRDPPPLHSRITFHTVLSLWYLVTTPPKNYKVYYFLIHLYTRLLRTINQGSWTM